MKTPPEIQRIIKESIEARNQEASILFWLSFMRRNLK